MNPVVDPLRQEHIEHWLVQRFLQVPGTTPAEIALDRPFTDYAFDSVIAVAISSLDWVRSAVMSLRSPPAKKVFFAEVMTTPVMSSFSPSIARMPTRGRSCCCSTSTGVAGGPIWRAGPSSSPPGS